MYHLRETLSGYIGKMYGRRRHTERDSTICWLRTLADTTSRVYRRFRHSFRYKLLLLVLLPLLVFIPLIIVFTLHRSYSFAQAQLFHKVRTDINIAESSLGRQQQKYLDAITQLAESHAFYTAMRTHNTRRINNLLQLLKVTEGLDFVHIIDLHGKLLYDDAVFSRTTKPSRLISNAVHSGLPQAGLELYSPAYLFRELDFPSHDNDIEPLANAVETLQSESQQAMVILAVYPIKNDQGQTIALLEGGVLLNGNTTLIDAISSLVYGHDSLETDDHSIISIILNNKRIATDLSNEVNRHQLALGSTIPGNIRQTVIHHNQQWVGEIKTPGGVYLSAFQPLQDYQGNNIGILEAGYLAAPLRRAYQNDLIITSLLLLLCAIGASTIAILAARRIFKPIERIAEVIYAQEKGNDQRIGDIHSQDEIGAVARRFDHMLDLLHERNAEIQRAADNLEQQVQTRTQELLRKNSELQATIDLLGKTRQQLVWAEKFAALGELTAGIAHEINNPAAVIMGNMDVLKEELAETLAPFDTEVTLIYEQLLRIRAIVENLLKYSRSSPMSQDLQMVDVNKLISDSLLLVRHEAVRKQAKIETVFTPDCRVNIDPQELQQVLINLLLNAIHAISEQGNISIQTSRNDSDNISIQISDDGAGIDPGQIARIFDPFYTTKGNQGTGLGLSISYGLVHRYGGNLEVDSSPTTGTVFTITLRKQPQLGPPRQLLFDLYSHSKAMKG